MECGILGVHAKLKEVFSGVVESCEFGFVKVVEYLAALT